MAADPSLRELDRLEGLLEQLKREYDLFLAGNRRGEPNQLRRQVEREVLRLTRYPFTSTVGRFRARTLAHRFHAVEAQVRHLVEARARKRREPGPEPEAAVVLDRAALANPHSVDPHLRRIHEAIRAATGETTPGPSFEALKRRLLEETRKRLGQGGVRGIRFSVSEGERGAKVRGEILAEVPAGPEDEGAAGD